MTKTETTAVSAPPPTLPAPAPEVVGYAAAPQERKAAIERAMADLLVSAEWDPHVKTVQPGVYASRFPGKDRTLWLLVNRTNKTIAGDSLPIFATCGNLSKHFRRRRLPI